MLWTHVISDLNGEEIVGSFYVPKETKRFIAHKDIKTNVFRIQACNSIICGYFCIGFIDFMFAGRSLIDFSSWFSPYDFDKNDKIILDYFESIF